MVGVYACGWDSLCYMPITPRIWSLNVISANAYDAGSKFVSPIATFLLARSNPTYGYFNNNFFFRYYHLTHPILPCFCERFFFVDQIFSFKIIFRKKLKFLIGLQSTIYILLNNSTEKTRAFKYPYMIFFYYILFFFVDNHEV